MPFEVESVDENEKTVTVVHQRGHRVSFAFPTNRTSPKLIGSPDRAGGERPDDLWIDKLAATAGLAEA